MEQIGSTDEASLRAKIRDIILELAPGAGSGVEGNDLSLNDDLSYHSLALLELAFTLEDEFDLSPIDEQTARKIRTIEDVQNHVVTEFKITKRISTTQSEAVSISQ